MLIFLSTFFPGFPELFAQLTFKGIPGAAPGIFPYKGWLRFSLGFASVLKPRFPGISLIREIESKRFKKPIGFPTSLLTGKKLKSKPIGQSGRETSVENPEYRPIGHQRKMLPHEKPKHRPIGQMKYTHHKSHGKNISDAKASHRGGHDT